MAYDLEADEPVADALRRIAREQVERILADLDDDGADVHERVHEARKRCKEVRGLVRLVRPAFPAYGEVNESFRDAARRLSDLRDATSRIECLDALAERFGAGAAGDAFAEVRAALVARRDAAADEEDLPERVAAFRGDVEAARERIGGWELEEEGFDAVGGGLAKSYGRGRRAFRRSFTEPSVEAVHEWRKRVKYHRYHCYLLRRLWEPLVEERRNACKRLSDLLGDHHDLAVLHGELAASPGDYGGTEAVEAVLGLAGVRRKELEAWAFPLGRRLYAEKPKRLRRRFGAYWEAWRSETELERGLAEGSAKVYS